MHLVILIVVALLKREGCISLDTMCKCQMIVASWNWNQLDVKKKRLYVSCECPVDRFDMVECIVHLTFESEFDLKSKLFGSIGTKLLIIISYTRRSNWAAQKGFVASTISATYIVAPTREMCSFRTKEYQFWCHTVSARKFQTSSLIPSSILRGCAYAHARSCVWLFCKLCNLDSRAC